VEGGGPQAAFHAARTMASRVSCLARSRRDIPPIQIPPNPNRIKFIASLTVVGHANHVRIHVKKLTAMTDPFAAEM
jgi:hypothetical protein